MIDIKLTKKTYWNNQVEGFIVFLTEDFESAADISKIEKDYYPHVKSILRKHKFKGKIGQSFVLTALKEKKLVQFVFVGAGKRDGKWDQELENFRRAIGEAVNRLKKLDISSSVLQLPKSKIFKVDRLELVKQIVIVALMADYEFAKFKTVEKNKVYEGKLFITSDEKEYKKLNLALNEGTFIAHAVNQTRHFADMPPNIATPKFISSQFKKIAKQRDLKYSDFGRKKAEELLMGGFLSVDAGSDQEGKFVILEYKSNKKSSPTVALVGKGVTFDSGGISLKPASGMTGMKFDMSGAAAVVGAMQAIAQLKPAVNVVAITPLVENMPSGKSNKQDDIITFMNGKTAEIINTDAEGRLILADALCYAEKFYSPDIIIDVATLTGACLYALGYFFTGLMTKDENLSSKLQDCSKLTGDRVWPLPLHEDFKPAIKSKVADMANCGSINYKASTITAGWFLNNFVNKARWVHLDIAGTANDVPGINYLGNGATGAGVRLLVEFIKNL